MTQYARRFLKLIFATSPYRRCGTRVWSLRVRAWLFVASGWFLGGTLPPPCLAAGSDFTLASPEISAGVVATEQVLNAFGCTGRNISPALSWRGAPAATKSLALTFFDPDARQGAGFWHWLVINIPATATGLPRGASQRDLPAGSLPTRTDFGRPGYGGPCPPVGDAPHHYLFTLYALDVVDLTVRADTPPAAVDASLRHHALALARITATYGR